MNRILSAFQGSSLMSRVLRSASWVMLGYGLSQALRLASNLVLTRLLFPEAFGMMTLVGLVVVGMQLFSDIGIGTSIIQNKRGDEPDFLDTAWTLQVLRGFILYGLACAVAGPVASFYGEPELARYLPIAALALLLAGFNPTRMETANRHLMIGRLIVLDLSAQVIGVIFMIGAAIILQSVMALVLGGVVQAAAKLALMHFLLPGHRNRPRWESAAAKELIRFGKWIFLSTGMTFLLSQGDRAILGKFLSLEVLGLYNIGFFLGNFPMMLGHAVFQRVMIPVYRDRPDQDKGGAYLRKMRLLRAGLTVGTAGLLLIMALVGPALVGVLYDDRYLMSGPMVALIATAFLPQAIFMTYDAGALAAGDGRSFFVTIMLRATGQALAILAGVKMFGLVGGIMGIAIAALATYPAIIWVARKHNVWDPRHDVLAGSAALAGAALVLSIHGEKISALLAF
ncbi:oligosaccharide flippase family protein [Lutimaribacter marinistellae]|uniref:Oligosaccharide flippase family protein n=1 Tax=Lutimaribacter marinistellae TaxID=1820329 RepID=A0ABV7TH12_9RHOB